MIGGPFPTEPGSPRRSKTRARGGTSSGNVFHIEEHDAAAEPDQVTSSSYSSKTAAAIDTATEELLDAVHTAGARLLADRTYQATQQYREAVRAFMARVLPAINDVIVNESGMGLLSRKRYFLLSEVNAKVDELVRGVLSNQREQISILAKTRTDRGALGGSGALNDRPVAGFRSTKRYPLYIRLRRVSEPESRHVFRLANWSRYSSAYRPSRAQQLVVGAVLDQRAVVEDENLIRGKNGRQPVCDHD